MSEGRVVEAGRNGRLIVQAVQDQNGLENWLRRVVQLIQRVTYGRWIQDTEGEG